MLDFIYNIDPRLKTYILIGVIVIGAFVLSKALRWLISKSFVTGSEKIKVDPTRYKFFKNAVSMIVWVFAFAAVVSLIPKLRALAITLFAGAGVLLAILGFAAQQAFSNIVSGVFIVIFRPFRVGDLIKVGEIHYGAVEDITLRHTVINNFENKRIIIPNSVISSETIINDSIEDARICRWISVGISYDSDLEKALKIIQEVSERHPLSLDARTQDELDHGYPKVIVRVIAFGDSSVDLRAYVWTKDPYFAPQMHSDIYRQLKIRFDKEDIEIPYPHRTLVFKNGKPEQLINPENAKK
ncbi:MAG: small conductance mechanosensitive channel [Luteibaculaceae bacterium]|jgi:small conductance mechanosensitive channel